MRPFRALIRLNRIFALFNYRLLYRKPLFLVRVSWRLLLRKLFNTDPLTGINFSSHYLCNLSCQHCYEQAFREKTEQVPLTLEEKRTILKNCLRAGVLNVTFIGGEATIDPDIDALIKACQPWRTYITIASNGFNLDERRIVHFHRLGVDKFNFSIDSMEAERHDANRGRKGSHQRVLAAIDTCKKLGVDVSVQYVVYKDSTRTVDFKRIIDYAVERDIRLQFKPVIPFGGLEQQQELVITPEDGERMLALHRQNPMLIRDSYGGGCPAFQGTITITPYGEVQPCNAVQVSFGNLRNEPLADILKKGRAISWFDGTYDGCPPAEDFQFIDLCKKNRRDPTELPAAEGVFEVLKKTDWR